MNEFLKKQFQRIYWRYWRLRNLWPVWFYFLNFRSRKFWRNYLKNNNLSELQLRIAGELSRNGIAITNINELFKDNNINPTDIDTTQLMSSKDHGTNNFRLYLYDIEGYASTKAPVG